MFFLPGVYSFQTISLILEFESGLNYENFGILHEVKFQGLTDFDHGINSLSLHNKAKKIQNFEIKN